MLAPKENDIYVYIYKRMNEWHSQPQKWTPTFIKEKTPTYLVEAKQAMISTLHPPTDTLTISLMPPPHLTLAKPKSWFLKRKFHTIDIT